MEAVVVTALLCYTPLFFGVLFVMIWVFRLPIAVQTGPDWGREHHGWFVELCNNGFFMVFLVFTTVLSLGFVRVCLANRWRIARRSPGKPPKDDLDA
ncbi:MAG TPA: hypothetical protein VG406_29235 [Isosphaeraceae bacterium]|nr:hypothetical protein [Isosphaeraceae bacterium]